MRYSITALMLLSLIAAMLANVWLQRQRIARAQAAIQEIESEIKLLNLDEASIDSHIQVCELAIANNPLPSPYYLDAVKRLETQAAGLENNR